MLIPFGTNLYLADGPTVSFNGFPYPTRMAVARLSTGALWVWSPVALTEALATAVDALGPVAHIVSPNKLHHLFMPAWKARWPAARLHAPPGLSRKRKDIHFDAELDDATDAPWQADLAQVVFGGSFAMDEVAFFHRESRTAIFGDLIQRFPRAGATGWKGLVMRLDDLVGPHGSTPREWRLTFVPRRRARAARSTVLAWDAQRLVVAHGDCAATGAGPLIEAALRWI